MPRSNAKPPQRAVQQGLGPDPVCSVDEVDELDRPLNHGGSTGLVNLLEWGELSLPNFED